jgi:hypothetical protein
MTVVFNKLKIKTKKDAKLLNIVIKKLSSLETAFEFHNCEFNGVEMEKYPYTSKISKDLKLIEE